MTVSITLLGKPGCHLCDEARDVIEDVRSALAASGIETSLTELNILEDAQLARLHSEDIPVVMIGSKRHAIWRVDRDRFTAAIIKAARRPKFSLGSAELAQYPPTPRRPRPDPHTTKGDTGDRTPHCELEDERRDRRSPRYPGGRGR